ncbi:MAG: NAD(P)/FAD-dependent oxidoreductase [Pseudomonadota bacterium]
MQSDIVIIGAGPVGLFGVFQCGMLGMRCIVIDALDEIGGQCQALYREKPIYDIGGIPKIAAGDLIAQLREQAAPFAPQYILNAKVQQLKSQDAGVSLTLQDGRTILAKAVLIAAGNGAFGPKRPPIAAIDEFEDRSVWYFVKQREYFRGRNIMIAGGGDSALDWALDLSEIAKTTHLVHRRTGFRAAPASLAALDKKIAEGAITLHAPRQLHAVEGTDGMLHTVLLRDLDGQEFSQASDDLLCFFGLSSDVQFLKDSAITCKGNLALVDQATQRTNQPRIYAIGDICHYEGKLKLILQGFSEAAIAAHDAYHYVFPDKALHFEHSTTRGIPQS